MASLAVTDDFLDRPYSSSSRVLPFARSRGPTGRLKADVSLGPQGWRCACLPRSGSGIDHRYSWRRDLPFYDTVITPASVAAMTQFSRDIGILQGQPSYTDVVASRRERLLVFVDGIRIGDRTTQHILYKP